ncbi:putative SH3 type 3 domain protein [uncultured Desulfatiglans sp.]|uniref:Putative SH3 type 3 domain protein n=1 Tax=Uncultured Desulfatiglans sp. TaxID=1748965 RepID=A0A653A7R2_UNCDX|nr:putative SH3 type 3 domain protein [uncultured Desulfatiglans sp.]
MRIYGLALGCFVLLMICGSAWAERAYVTDSFQVTVRTGPSTGHKIIAFLDSGASVEVLGEDQGWNRVRLRDEEGKSVEGWVLARYLMTREPWEAKARSFEEKYERLKALSSKTKGEWESVYEENQHLTSQLAEKTSALQTLEQEHERLKKDSADVLAVKEAHRQCSETLAGLEKTVGELRKENDALRSNERNKWFATGALVLFVGLIIGLALGRSQKKRKSLLMD